MSGFNPFINNTNQPNGFNLNSNNPHTQQFQGSNNNRSGSTRNPHNQSSNARGPNTPNPRNQNTTNSSQSQQPRNQMSGPRGNSRGTPFGGNQRQQSNGSRGNSNNQMKMNQNRQNSASFGQFSQPSSPFAPQNNPFASNQPTQQNQQQPRGKGKAVRFANQPQGNANPANFPFGQHQNGQHQTSMNTVRGMRLTKGKMKQGQSQNSAQSGLFGNNNNNNQNNQGVFGQNMQQSGPNQNQNSSQAFPFGQSNNNNNNNIFGSNQGMSQSNMNHNNNNTTGMMMNLKGRGSKKTKSPFGQQFNGQQQQQQQQQQQGTIGGFGNNTNNVNMTDNSFLNVFGKQSSSVKQLVANARNNLTKKGKKLPNLQNATNFLFHGQNPTAMRLNQQNQNNPGFSFGNNENNNNVNLGNQKQASIFPPPSTNNPFQASSTGIFGRQNANNTNAFTFPPQHNQQQTNALFSNNQRNQNTQPLTSPFVQNQPFSQQQQRQTNPFSPAKKGRGFNKRDHPSMGQMADADGVSPSTTTPFSPASTSNIKNSKWSKDGKSHQQDQQSQQHQRNGNSRDKRQLQDGEQQPHQQQQQQQQQRQNKKRDKFNHIGPNLDAYDTHNDSMANLDDIDASSSMPLIDSNIDMGMGDSPLVRKKRLTVVKKGNHSGDHTDDQQQSEEDLQQKTTQGVSQPPKSRKSLTTSRFRGSQQQQNDMTSDSFTSDKDDSIGAQFHASNVSNTSSTQPHPSSDFRPSLTTHALHSQPPPPQIPNPITISEGPPLYIAFSLTKPQIAQYLCSNPKVLNLFSLPHDDAPLTQHTLLQSQELSQFIDILGQSLYILANPDEIAATFLPLFVSPPVDTTAVTSTVPITTRTPEEQEETLCYVLHYIVLFLSTIVSTILSTQPQSPFTTTIAFEHHSISLTLPSFEQFNTPIYNYLYKVHGNQGGPMDYAQPTAKRALDMSTTTDPQSTKKPYNSQPTANQQQQQQQQQHPQQQHNYDEYEQDGYGEEYSDGDYFDGEGEEGGYYDEAGNWIGDYYDGEGEDQFGEFDAFEGEDGALYAEGEFGDEFYDGEGEVECDEALDEQEEDDDEALMLRLTGQSSKTAKSVKTTKSWEKGPKGDDKAERGQEGRRIIVTKSAQAAFSSTSDAKPFSSSPHRKNRKDTHDKPDRSTNRHDWRSKLGSASDSSKRHNKNDDEPAFGRNTKNLFDNRRGSDKSHITPTQSSTTAITGGRNQREASNPPGNHNPSSKYDLQTDNTNSKPQNKRDSFRNTNTSEFGQPSRNSRLQNDFQHKSGSDQQQQRTTKKGQQADDFSQRSSATPKPRSFTTSSSTAPATKTITTTPNPFKSQPFGAHSKRYNNSQGESSMQTSKQPGAHFQPQSQPPTDGTSGYKGKKAFNPNHLQEKFGNIACKFGDKCTRPGCAFKHDY